MRTLLPQLTLSLTSNDETRFEHFYQGNNREALKALKNASAGSGERMIYLCSTSGLGCSHLLQAACQEAKHHHFISVYLPLKELAGLSPDLLQGLESIPLVCIDDLEAVAGSLIWEEAFFHLFNRINDAGGRLIVAAHALPKAIPFLLNDLASRLAGMVLYQLAPLGDDEKRAVLCQRALHRGMTLSDDVARYIMTHCSREMRALLNALDQLDKASLAAQRRLTIPFVRNILKLEEGQ